jgi:hypothetical protein
MSALPAPARTRRIAGVVAVAAGAVLALAGCHPGTGSPSSSSTESASGSAAPSASPTPTISLPADAVLSLTAEVTADNGATATVTAVVHRPLAPTDAAAAAMVTRMTTVCDGEVDAGVLVGQKAMMVKIDYSSTVTRGSWPADLPLALYPAATYDELVAAGDPGVVQKEVLDPNAGPGDYVPNCLQQAFLTVGQSGSTFAAEYIDPSQAAGLDNSTFWAALQYGFVTPYPLFPAKRVTFAHCTDTVTALGQSLKGSSVISVSIGPDGDPTLGDSCLAGGQTGY